MKSSAQNCEVKIFPDAAALNEGAASFIVKTAVEVLQTKDKFSVALSGGSTPKSLYALLASDKFKNEIDWRRTLVFFSDERCVPPDDEESNFRMAREALLSKIEIPDENIFRLRGELSPSEAAAEYETAIKKNLGENPAFDLILLGLGDDGHTASLFPETAALKENKNLVAENFIEKFNSYRLTLTFPVINSAAQVIFLVTGAKKAPMVKRVLSEKAFDLPASLVKPENGRCFWFLDEVAAKLL